MSSITVGQENGSPIELYYEDLGSGSPVVLIHGWPLSGASWEKQVTTLLAAGHRVITYDRRGFGRSSKPSVGYDYDTLAADLEALLTGLHLRDCALVGFSMGGGEVARYLGRSGSESISRVCFISSITPFRLKTADNPTGLDGSGTDATQRALLADRPALLAEFFARFYSIDEQGTALVSPQVLQFSWDVAVNASPKGTYDCVSAFNTDFREDARGIDVPTLILHGSGDRILPPAATAVPMSKLVDGSRLVIIEGAPHGMLWTHAEQVNEELVRFLSAAVPVV